MDKKHITIIGTCCSRLIFNMNKLQEIFDIDLYIFKNNPFMMIEEGLNIPKDKIAKMKTPEFSIRNIEYDINKSAIKEILSKRSEYIIIDLFTLRDKIYKISYNNKVVYITTNNFQENKDEFINCLKKQNINVKCEAVDFQNINEDIIINGLKKLSKFLEDNFENIIINIPKVAKKYYSLDNKLVEYNNKKLEDYLYWENIVDKYSRILSKNISKAKILEWDNNVIGRNLFYSDFINGNVPNAVHLIHENYSVLENRLLNLLGINYTDYYKEPLSPDSLNYEILMNRYVYLNYKFDKITKFMFCNINGYTNFLKRLKNHLIVFCVHADAQNKIKYWNNRFLLGLNFKFNFRDSYIGIIDTKNNFKYENSSKDALTYTYNIPNTEDKVFIESHGFYANNFSSIKFRSQEYSKQKRGINIFVLDLNLMSVVDCANCDTCLDNDLKMDSNMLSVFDEK